MDELTDLSTSSDDENHCRMTLRLKTPGRSDKKSRTKDVVERSPLQEMPTVTNIPRPSARKLTKKTRVKERAKPGSVVVCQANDGTAIEEYRETIRALRKQIHSMACQMEARSRHVVERITSSHDPQSAEVLELQGEVEILREKLAARSRSVDLLAQEKDSLLQEISHMRATFSENKKHQRRLKELKEYYQENKATVETLERELREKNSVLIQQQNKHAETVKRLQEDLLKERESMMTEKLQDQNKYEEQVESLNKTLQAQSLAFEADLVEAKRTGEDTVAFQRKEFETTVTALRARVHSLEQKTTALDNALAQVTEERDEMSRHLANEKDERINSVETLLSAQASMLNEKALLEQQIETLHLSLEEKDQRLANESQQSIDSARLAENLQTQIARLEADLVKSTQNEQNARRAALREQQTVSRVQSELTELRERNAAQSHELGKLHKKNAAIDELRRVVEQSKLQQEKDHEEIATLTAKLTGSNGRVQQLELALEAELRSRAMLSEHNKELQSEQDEMRENKKKFDELKRDIVTMREKLLDGALESETRLLYETEVKRWMEETERLKEQVRQLELSKKQYRSLLQAYTTDSPEEPTLLQSYAETIHQLTVELENYEAGSNKR